MSTVPDWIRNAAYAARHQDGDALAAIAYWATTGKRIRALEAAQWPDLTYALWNFASGRLAVEPVDRGIVEQLRKALEALNDA